MRQHLHLPINSSDYILPLSKLQQSLSNRQYLVILVYYNFQHFQYNKIYYSGQNNPIQHILSINVPQSHRYPQICFFQCQKYPHIPNFLCQQIYMVFQHKQHKYSTNLASPFICSVSNCEQKSVGLQQLFQPEYQQSQILVQIIPFYIQFLDMKKVGVFGVATGLLANLGEACWYNTLQTTQEKLNTQNQIINVPCECDTDNVVYSYPILPSGWTADQNNFFIPAGRFQEKERKHVEVEIHNKDTEEIEKKVLVFEKKEGKIRTFEREQRDLSFEKRFNNLGENNQNEDQDTQSRGNQQGRGLINLGGIGARFNIITQNKQISSQSQQNQHLLKSIDEGKDEQESNIQDSDKKDDDDHKTNKDQANDFVLPDNDIIDELVEDGDQNAIKRIIKLCVESGKIAQLDKKTFLSNLKGRIEGFIGFRQQRKQFLKAKIEEHQNKIKQIKTKIRQNKDSDLEDEIEEEKIQKEANFFKNKLDRTRFKLKNLRRIRQKISNRIERNILKLTTIDQEINELEQQEAVCLKDHTTSIKKLQKIKQQKENKRKNDKQSQSELQKIEKQLKKAERQKKREEYRAKKDLQVSQKIQKVHEEVKKQIDINIVKFEGLKVVKTIVENKSVQLVITKNEFNRYLNQRFGKSEQNEHKNITIDETEEAEEVKIKKINIFGEKWRNAYGFSNIEQFQRGLKRGHEEKSGKPENSDKPQEKEKQNQHDFLCDDSPEDEGEQCVIDEINGNSIFAHSKKDNSKFELILGPCSNLEIKGDKEIPNIGDIIIFKGKKEEVKQAIADRKAAQEEEKTAKQIQIKAKKDAQAEQKAIHKTEIQVKQEENKAENQEKHQARKIENQDRKEARKSAKRYKVKHAVCY